MLVLNRSTWDRALVDTISMCLQGRIFNPEDTMKTAYQLPTPTLSMSSKAHKPRCISSDQTSSSYHAESTITRTPSGRI
jgi:hypothetical protein